MTYANKTISKHIDYLTDAFLISKASRYDIKGRKYIGANLKYYFTDLGLRNARLNFRQQEPTHIMEIVLNELLILATMLMWVSWISSIRIKRQNVLQAVWRLTLW